MQGYFLQRLEGMYNGQCKGPWLETIIYWLKSHNLSPLFLCGAGGGSWLVDNSVNNRFAFSLLSDFGHLFLGFQKKASSDTLQYRQLTPFPGTKALLIPSNRDKVHHKPGCGVEREAEERCALFLTPLRGTELNKISQFTCPWQGSQISILLSLGPSWSWLQK